MVNAKSKIIDDNQGWDLIIKPTTRLLHFDIAEIWRYRDLLMLLVKRDFVAQYKQTLLGPLWHLIQPILMSIMYMLIFGKIAQIPTDGIPPILFYLSGITIWNYFSVCFVNTSTTFISNAHIFGKVYFPRIIIPLSVVISNMIRFSIQLLLVFILMAYMAATGEKFIISLNLFYVPLILLITGGLGLGLGIIISALTTKFRDLVILMSFGVQLLMFATPVVYPMSYLNSFKYLSLLHYNPLSPLIEGFRYALFGSLTYNTYGLLYSMIVMFVILLIGIITFNRVEKSFMDTI